MTKEKAAQQVEDAKEARKREWVVAYSNLNEAWNEYPSDYDGDIPEVGICKAIIDDCEQEGLLNEIIKDEELAAVYYCRSLDLFKPRYYVQIDFGIDNWNFNEACKCMNFAAETQCRTKIQAKTSSFTCNQSRDRRRRKLIWDRRK